MKIDTSREVIDNIPAQDSADYHIDPSSAVHIMRILRNMYKDPVRAVVREYLANAIDAHRDAGVHRAIEINAPSTLNPVFKMRDYGRGLSVEDVKHKLLGYGVSGAGKRETQFQIGGYGVGCKCAHAVTDAFTYISWHNGMKQVWLCQINNDDAGEAKLISHQPSAEPSGIQVIIPVANSQLKMYERHIKHVPLFVNEPLIIDGMDYDPYADFVIEITGTLNNYTGDNNDEPVYNSGWEIITHRLTDGILPPVVIVMGGIWYPVDMKYIKLRNDTPMLCLTRRAGRSCIIHIPIGSIELAPTRESLQYTSETVGKLKSLIGVVESGIQEGSQAKIDAEPTLWRAGSLAIKLNDLSMYRMPESRYRMSTLSGYEDVDLKGFEWRGKKYTYFEDLAVPAGAQPSGVTVMYAVRDTRTMGKQRYNHMHAKMHSHYSPAESSLKVHHFATHEAVHVKHTASYSGKNLSRMTIRGTKMPEHIPTGSSYAACLSPHAHTDTNGMVKRYVFSHPIPVRTLPRGVSAPYYARRWLTSNKHHAPHAEGYMLIIQGTDDERKEFFNEYPWLEYDAEELPVSRTVRKRTQKAERSHPKVRRFQSRGLDTWRPSSGWKEVTHIMGEEPLYVYIDRCIPLMKGSQSASDMSNHAAFAYLQNIIECMRIITGEYISVYGVKHTDNAQKVLPGGVSLHRRFSEVLKDWHREDTLGRYPIHSYQLYLAYGPACLFEFMGMEKADLLKRRSTDHISELLEPGLLQLIMTDKVRVYVEKYIRDGSPFKELTRTMADYLDLDTVSADRYNEFRQQVTAVHSATATTGCVATEVQLPPSKHAAFRRFVRPVQEALDLVWKAYPMLEELRIIYKTLHSATPMLEYVRMVDDRRVKH